MSIPRLSLQNGTQTRLDVRQREKFYDSPEWMKVRYAALRRSLGCCDCCGARGSVNSPLHVDHIKPRSKYPELELAESNLQVLCRHCNMGKGNQDEIDWRWMPSKELIEWLRASAPENETE